MKTHTPKYLKDYRPPAYWIDKIDLQFDLADDQTIVTSTMKIRRNNDVSDKLTPLVLDCRDLDIISVVADDMVLCSADYELTPETFTLPRVPELFVLEIKNRLVPHNNTALEGLYRSGRTFCTQCEAQGFRRITCFPDRPDVMTLFSCIITAEKKKYPVLLSNGNPVASGDLDNGRHYVKWEDPFKKPSYLFALVAGDLSCIEDHFTTFSGKNITLKIFVEHENKDKCSHAMKSLKESMAWDEERFGREYDLDLYQIVAVNDFNMGAMENKGLNIFNSKYVLAKTETATDTDFMNIQRVIAHEYFHNWTGNRITLKNWFQLSLKEGLTVFRDQEFSSDLNSRAVQRISDVRKLRTFQFPEDAGSMAHPVRPESYIEMNNFYTMTVYEKGSEVIRMMFEILGRELFRKGMDLYFARFDGQAVTTEDFVQIMEEASGIDLSQFRLWYSQSGTPRIKVKREYDSANRTLTIHLTQNTPPDHNQSEKKPLHIPVKYGLVSLSDSNGNSEPSGNSEPNGNSEPHRNPEQNDHILHLKEQHQTFTFNDIAPETRPSLFREFSAPVIIENDFSAEDLAFLMANDTDEFNRWDAAQQLYFMELKRIIGLLQDEKASNPDKTYNDMAPPLSEHLVNAFRESLCNTTLDRALIAQTITLPGESEIAQQYDPIDVDAIHRARQIMKQTIAEKLATELDDIIDLCSKADPEDLSHEAMADRSLKNIALSYIGSLDSTSSHQIIHKHYINAMNMTDKIGALSILCNSTCEESTLNQALAQFHLMWREDPLVLDKWFTVQASSTRPGTLENIKALTCHPDFSWRNPNRVRSVMSILGTGNPYIFHRKDGNGYAFFAEKIIQLDKINSQIAARLAGAFNHWKKYDLQRRTLMQQQLEIMVNTPDLSRDVYEIVSKALSA
ncbi:Aminopeptidase N [Desulfamplus magnetovallimortis]|uniref:Aminopeptidase N n=1 Tax=Desulfamplus magnetovallimortis TaxID=1246637 RepID=A0A1W1HDS9_9BACT|nr:aminopeptidase N [Desulfamplus magnetovallimortis]SLM30542.1 Aminopeptidase N [Desulfamplus magnetovallimortis]